MFSFKWDDQKFKKLKARSEDLEFANRQLKIALGKYKAEVDRLKKQLKNPDKKTMIFIVDNYKNDDEVRSFSRKFGAMTANRYKVINVDQMPVGNSGISYVITYVDDSE